MKAFTFKTFGQMILDNADIFQASFRTVKELYEKDELFKKYVLEDSKITNHNLGEREIVFILEEITVFYLAQKGKMRLNNEFINDYEKKWVLQAYSGKPLKSEVYLFQKNPLNLSNPANVYENSYYDLEEQKLYDYLRIDLETINLS